MATLIVAFLTFTMNKNQNVAIIDIGSNSVRERISCNGKVFLRRFITTQLAKNMQNGLLCEQSIERTFKGLDELFALAKEQNAKVFAFATAAVRNAKNGGEFVSRFFDRYAIFLDVLSGEQEGKMGVLGALKGKSGCIIDVGGASSEVVCAIEGNIIYSHSMPVGAVSLTDQFLKIFDEACSYLTERVDSEFVNLPTKTGTVYGIGGSANIIAFIKSELKQFDRDKTNLTVVSQEYLFGLVEKLYSMTDKQVEDNFLIDPLRAKVIHSGALILATLLKKLNAHSIILTEDDNLEGYYLWLEKEGKI